MYYSPSELYHAWNSASNKSKQLKILAQINACTEDDIRCVIEEYIKEKQKMDETYGAKLSAIRQSCKDVSNSIAAKNNSTETIDSSDIKSGNSRRSRKSNPNTTLGKPRSFDYDAIKDCISSGMGASEAARSLGYEDNINSFRATFGKIKKQLAKSEMSEDIGDDNVTQTVQSDNRVDQFFNNLSEMKSDIHLKLTQVSESLEQLNTIQSQLTELHTTLSKYELAIELLEKLDSNSNK